MLNCETLFTAYSQLFGPSCKFGKCFTLSYFFVCPSNLFDLARVKIPVPVQVHLKAGLAGKSGSKNQPVNAEKPSSRRWRHLDVCFVSLCVQAGPRCCGSSQSPNTSPNLPETGSHISRTPTRTPPTSR